ncbi:hypothetical protein [Actinomadura sp. 3N407]|uniref:hypothetical protein n=1 Tax=Actinomadura sp. 3N407 TaxID=3457423 RepID=UPI003FCE680F
MTSTPEPTTAQAARSQAAASATASRRASMTPEQRRRENLRAFWQQRYQACADDPGELARVSFDRARAAATRAQRAGVAPMAMYELAELLHKWAEQVEAKHQEAGHAP